MTAVLGGFDDPVLSAQTAFRAVMNALARPGSCHAMERVTAAPAPLSRTAAAIALTLLDHDTPLWLDQRIADAPEVSAWIRFHTGAPIVADRAKAAFAIVSEPHKAPDFADFCLGSAEYPDRSTTIIFEVGTFDDGEPLDLSGPGINGRTVLRPGPLPADIRVRLSANRALFPRGVDLLLAGPSQIAALPRTVVTAGGY